MGEAEKMKTTQYVSHFFAIMIENVLGEREQLDNKA